MKDVEINIKVLKNRVFFSIPLDVWDPGSMTSINGYILNGNLIIPLYSEIIGFSDDELTLLRKLSSIKFNQRRVRDILRSLTPKEKKTMDKLDQEKLRLLNKINKEPQYLLNTSLLTVIIIGCIFAIYKELK